MPTDPWEQLAQTPVPPPPVEFDRGVHERINVWLVVGQLADFVVRALPYGMYHFARGLLGAIVFSLSGRFPLEQKPLDPKADNKQPPEKNSPPDVT